MKKSETKCSFCGNDADHCRMMEGGQYINGSKAYICYSCIRLFFGRLLKYREAERNRMCDEAFNPAQSQPDPPHSVEQGSEHGADPP